MIMMMMKMITLEIMRMSAVQKFATGGRRKVYSEKGKTPHVRYFVAIKFLSQIIRCLKGFRRAYNDDSHSALEELSMKANY